MQYPGCQCLLSKMYKMKGDGKMLVEDEGCTLAWFGAGSAR